MAYDYDNDELIQAVWDERPYCDCGEHMKPIGDTDIFKCPLCGAKYGLFEYIKTGPYSDVLRPYYFPDEPGEGCIACGGPYPLCKTSCGLFDD